jgi:hypothetical protein
MGGFAEGSEGAAVVFVGFEFGILNGAEPIFFVEDAKFGHVGFGRGGEALSKFVDAAEPGFGGGLGGIEFGGRRRAGAGFGFEAGNFGPEFWDFGGCAAELVDFVLEGGDSILRGGSIGGELVAFGNEWRLLLLEFQNFGA